MLALWWWIDRWRKSTAYMDMTLEQQGGYRNLLDEACLRGGPLPNDERVLAKACGDVKAWRKIRPVVMARFTLIGDGWRNETLDEVMNRTEEIRQERSESGRLGAEKRWQNHGKRDGKEHGKEHGKPIANGMANGMAPDPDPSPDQKERKKRATHVGPPKEPADPRVREFLQWFQGEYQHRRNGAEYLVKWGKHGALVKQMLGATDPDRLKKFAQILLNEKTDDAFIVSSDRGIEMLSARFSWLSDRLAAWETRQKTPA